MTESTQTVLVVDDDRHIRNSTRIRLQNAGYRTLEAEDGCECLKVVDAEAPDAILLDLSMPVMDGFETMRRLQTSEATERIPIVVASARTRDQTYALDSGARYFVSKPYCGKELTEAVSAALKHTKHQANAGPSLQSSAVEPAGIEHDVEPVPDVEAAG